MISQTHFPKTVCGGRLAAYYDSPDTAPECCSLALISVQGPQQYLSLRGGYFQTRDKVWCFQTQKCKTGVARSKVSHAFILQI